MHNPTLTFFYGGDVLRGDVRSDDPVLELELYKLVVFISDLVKKRFDETYDASKLP